MGRAFGSIRRKCHQIRPEELHWSIIYAEEHRGVIGGLPWCASATVPVGGTSPPLRERAKMVDLEELREKRPWKRLLHGVVFFLLSSLLGCDGEECNYGATRCDDNAAEYCRAAGDGGGNEWQSRACGDAFCRGSADGRLTFCAQTSERVPECGTGSRSVCRGNEVIDCEDGYVVHAFDCTTGSAFPKSDGPSADGVLRYASADGGHCVAPAADVAFCAPTLEPEVPPCIQGQYVSICEDGDVLFCAYGYPIKRRTCRAGCSPYSTESAHCDS